MYRLRFSTSIIASIIFLLFSHSLFAQSLAESLEAELGPRPTKAHLIEALKKYRPSGADVAPEELILPEKYLPVLFGERAAEYIKRAQDTNPFVNPEAAESGFEVSNELANELGDWPFNPGNNRPFFIPHFEIRKANLQFGFISPNTDESLMAPIHNDAESRNSVSWWMFPDNLRPYKNFVEGGARGVRASGLGIEYGWIGIAPNSPRSLMAMNIDHPEWGFIHIKTNLHRRLDGHLRIMQAKKAPRVVLSSMLLETLPESLKRRWGFDFLPENASWALPFTQRINVVRDPSKLFRERGTKWAFGYSIFSPVGVEKQEDILANQWLGRSKSKRAFERFTRQIFRTVARPFAMNALVTGQQGEWHSANWLIGFDENGPQERVIFQDLESVRSDIELRLRNGFDLSPLQDVDQPFLNSKYSAASGRSTDQLVEGDEVITTWAKPEFIPTQYTRHVRGKVLNANYKGPTVNGRFEGFSTIVDQARQFGRNILGLDLTNAEVDRWMDDEMAKAVNEVLRDELKISARDIPNLRAEDIRREVEKVLTYIRKKKVGNIDSEIRGTRDWLRENGGLTRVMWQVRNHLSAQITPEHADPDIQEILKAEFVRLTNLRRNSARLYSNIDQQGLYFIFHEAQRVIEVRMDTDIVDKKYRGFVSLEPDVSTQTARFFRAFERIKGHKPAQYMGRSGRRGPASATTAEKCEELFGSERVMFGNRVAGQ